MTSQGPALRPTDRHDIETIRGFRSAGYWRDEVLAHFVDRWAEDAPDRVVVTDGYGSLDAGGLRARASRFAARLRELGISPGDRVLVQLPNWSEFVVTYVALARIGAVLVPAMPIYRHDEVAYVLQHSEAKLAIVAGEFRSFDHAAMLADLRASSPDLRHLVTVRADDERPEMLRYEDLVAGDGVPTPDELGPLPGADDPHCIIYTSGTEARPKGCLHTLNTVSFTVHALGEAVLELDATDVMFMPSPVTHATGLAMGVTTPLILGCGMHLMDVWDPVKALDRIADHRCTVSMSATPFVQMTLGALAADPAAAAKLGTMRRWLCAGAPIPEVMLRAWSEQVPSCSLLPVYGRSEGLLVTSCSVTDTPAQILGSDGKAFDGVELEIRDESGHPIVDGGEGEIHHGGPGLMLGYWNDPERTSESIDERGISASGDLGRVDADGYLRVTGRIKDLIIRGGTNISAVEVENHLLSHPKVAAVAVVAAPDQRLGEKACAFVVPQGDAPTLEELSDHLRNERRIAPQKVPELLQIVDSLPTTPTGKVQKFVLRDLAREVVEKVE